LEEREIEAWQKLIRVITHEIMNSITPISSLASTINEMLRDNFQITEENKKFESESLTDIHDAAQTIQKRSQGLLHFVDAYRNLTLIQKPNFQLFPVKELFARVEKLMQANIKDKGIRLKTNVDPKSLELTADPELIEQVLINLLLNALQSVGGQKKARIDLISQLDGRGRILVQVKDNGPGIEKDNLEKIFIPFFSTKDKGSGIGLSLSRQIMRLHHGSITVQSEPKKQTIFTLRF
jgi:signal transduction histidine kinase